MNYPLFLADAWVAMQALRNLGFPAEELYFTLANGIGIGPIVAVQVKREEAVFTWTIARIPNANPREIEMQWVEFAASMNAAADAERQAVAASSSIVLAGGPNYLALIECLNAKGFPATLPVTP